MALVVVSVAVPFAVALPQPTLEVWPYLALSAVLEAVYSLCLVAAYRVGDLGRVYPIVRGTVPVLIALGGYLVVGEALPTLTIVGIVLIVVSMGIPP